MQIRDLTALNNFERMITSTDKKDQYSAAIVFFRIDEQKFNRIHTIALKREH